MAQPKASLLITLKNQVSRQLTVIRKSLKGFENGLNSAVGVVKSWTVKTLAMGAAVVGLGTAFARAAGKVEQWKVRFETMTGSAEKGKEVLDDLTKLAAESPFDMPQVVEGAAKLNAMGFEAEELTERMRMLGDITAGVGTEKMPQLVLAFGQVKTAGKLTGQELRQFNEAGVDLLGGLAENLGKTKAEIKDMVSEGKIGFKDVDTALKSMTDEGGRFFGLMDELSGTFLGKVSNIKDNFFQIAVAVGDELLPEMESLTDSVQEFTDNEQNIKNIAVSFKTVFLAIKAVGIALTDAIGSSNLFLLKMDLFMAKATKATVTVWGKIKGIFVGVDKENEALIAKIEADIEDMQRNILQKDANLKKKLAEAEQEWTDSFIDLQKKKQEATEALNSEMKAYLEELDEVEGATEALNSEMKAYLEELDEVEGATEDVSDASEGLNFTEPISETIAAVQKMEKHLKGALEFLDQLITGGSLEASIDQAQRKQAKAIRDINRDFERGEISKQEQLKKTRDVTEEFSDTMSDIRDEALDMSKVRLTDVFDPLGAAARIDDANKAISSSRFWIGEADKEAQKLNDSYKDQVRINEELAFAKKEDAKATAEAEKAAEKAKRENEKAIEDEQRLLDRNNQKLEGFTNKQTDLNVDLKRDFEDINKKYDERLATANEIRNADLRQQTITGIESERLAALQGVSLSFARRFSDLGVGLARAGIDTAGTASTVDDVTMVNLTKAITDMTQKLSDLSVNVDVGDLSSKLSKNLTQYETLNTKGRI